MSGNGAYPKEMDFSHPEIATFSRAPQATLVREPDPATSEAMVRWLDEARFRDGRGPSGHSAGRPRRCQVGAARTFLRAAAWRLLRWRSRCCRC